MEALDQKRCLHHPAREAVARCPECSHFFCRECIVEHDDRVICAQCLKKLAAKPRKTRARLAVAGHLCVAAGGFLAAWFYFFSLGRMLLLIPASFHDGTLWHHLVP
jgi:uncharacterized paraquat-inducible protein A